MKKILLIVDPQNDFITGSLAVEGAKEKRITKIKVKGIQMGQVKINKTIIQVFIL